MALLDKPVVERISPINGPTAVMAGRRFREIRIIASKRSPFFGKVLLIT
jgi:hypothetical protein